jgi:hypothetical protein
VLSYEVVMGGDKKNLDDMAACLGSYFHSNQMMIYKHHVVEPIHFQHSQ